MISSSSSNSGGDSGSSSCSCKTFVVPLIDGGVWRPARRLVPVLWAAGVEGLAAAEGLVPGELEVLRLVQMVSEGESGSKRSTARTIVIHSEQLLPARQALRNDTPPFGLMLMPVTSGERPVMNELRLGPHTACWQYALSKVSAAAASLSKFGVLTCVWPYATFMSGLMSSAIIQRTFLAFGGSIFVPVNQIGAWFPGANGEVPV